MCGIMGYTGYANAVPVIIDGLCKLEYRGYDSAGIAIYREEKLEITKKKDVWPIWLNVWAITRKAPWESGIPAGLPMAYPATAMPIPIVIQKGIAHRQIYYPVQHLQLQ